MECDRNMGLTQGDIVLVTLDPTVGHEQAKTRPCVVIQCTQLNRIGTTIVAPITSKIFTIPYPNIVHIDSLEKPGCIKIEQVRCIDQSRIKKMLGKVSTKELQKIKQALAVVFDLE